MITLFENYKQTNWNLRKVEMTDETRLVAVTRTGPNKKKGDRSYPVFSVVPNYEKGLQDEALEQIRQSLYYYTLPNRETFIKELEVILSDLYKVEVVL